MELKHLLNYKKVKTIQRRTTYPNRVMRDACRKKYLIMSIKRLDMWDSEPRADS